MITKRLLWAGMIFSLLMTCVQAEEKKDKSQLLIGKWQVTKTGLARELPVDSKLEFGKDGQMKIALKGESIDAVYEVKGDKLQFALKLSPDKTEKKPPITIKKISEQQLVLELKNGVTIELKRVK